MVTLGRDQTQTAAPENEDGMKLNNNNNKNRTSYFAKSNNKTA